MKSSTKIVTLLALVILLTATVPDYSQCSMCRAVAESGSRDDSKQVARGLNNGILYLLSMPYILGGVAYFIWRKNRKKPLVAAD
jgi:prolipoprotein diacylglyceryltransferase